MMPGAASLPARPARWARPAARANIDGGSIIANNIISDFGLGHTALDLATRTTAARSGSTPAKVPRIRRLQR